MRNAFVIADVTSYTPAAGVRAPVVRPISEGTDERGSA